jgi:hypothetical protein
MTLSEDGSVFQANAVVQNYDASGNLLTTLQSTEVGSDSEPSESNAGVSIR